MRILVVNWTWYPSGGDWTYVDNICKFYESRGHEVIPFSMKDERNFPTPYSSYFISNIDYKSLNKDKSIYNGLRTIKNSLYSVESKKNIRTLLDEHKVDLVHLNNIHHYLTPGSIIPEIKKRGIPIIWTLHDYVILCPNTTFISNDQVCEKCRGGAFYHCAINKCKKGSFAASVVASMESYTNKFINPYKYVDYFLCPSKFIAQKFIDFGFDRNKIRGLYNIFNTEEIKDVTGGSAPKNKYILCVANILKVKGILTLVKAAKGLDITVNIIGSGESFEEFENYAKKEQVTNVHFLGKKPKSEVLDYVKNAQFLVVPSEWYENLPYSLVEALLLSKPVLGAKIGGIPELVIEDETGYLFEPGNTEDLKRKIIYMLSLDSGKLLELGNNAQKHAYDLVNADSFHDNLSPVFQSLGLKL